MTDTHPDPGTGAAPTTAHTARLPDPGRARDGATRSDGRRWRADDHEVQT